MALAAVLATVGALAGAPVLDADDDGLQELDDGAAEDQPHVTRVEG
ncbi:MAG TPA: hypothetical protein VF223_16945 [Trebonia sp.]